MGELFRLPPRSSACYGDVGNQRRLYQHLLDLDTRQTIAAYGDSPEGLAVALKCAFDPLRCAIPLGREDLENVRHFITSEDSARDARARTLIDGLLPAGDPERCRLPLVVSRRDFKDILVRFIVMDFEYCRRVLFLRALLVLALDHGLLSRNR